MPMDSAYIRSAMPTTHNAKKPSANEKSQLPPQQYKMTSMLGHP